VLADEGLAVELDDEVIGAIPVLELEEVAVAGRLERAASAVKDAVVPVTFLQVD
jgi:hypothetical protein